MTIIDLVAAASVLGEPTTSPPCAGRARTATPSLRVYMAHPNMAIIRSDNLSPPAGRHKTATAGRATWSLPQSFAI
jgi:hypothetical protein